MDKNKSMPFKKNSAAPSKANPFVGGDREDDEKKKRKNLEFALANVKKKGR